MSVWSAMADQARINNPEVIQEAWQKHMGKMNQPLPDVDGQPAEKEAPLQRLLRGTESLLTSGNPSLVKQGRQMLSQYHTTANRDNRTLDIKESEYASGQGFEGGLQKWKDRNVGRYDPNKPIDFFGFAHKMGLDPKSPEAMKQWRLQKGVTDSSAIQQYDLLTSLIDDPNSNPEAVRQAKSLLGTLKRDLVETKTGYVDTGDPENEVVSKNIEAGIWEDVYGGDVAEFLVNAKSDFANTEYQIQSMDRTRSDLNRAIEETTGFTTGIAGLLKIIPGTPQKDLANIIGGIQSRVGIQTIKDMKDASKTGTTGFGAISAPELDILLSYFGRLDQETSKEQLMENLKLIDSEMNRLQNKLRKGRRAGYKRFERLSKNPTYSSDIDPYFLEQNKGVLEPHVETFVDPKTGITYEMTEEM